jgi:hypothetical protein
MKILMFSWNGEVDISQFDYDLCFLQRYKKRYAEQIAYKNYYTNNYGQRGLCIIDKNQVALDVEVNQFDDYIIDVIDESQGQYWQTFKVGKYKIINSSVCYPSNEMPISVYYNQGKQLLNLIDDNTLILTDLHGEDYEIEEEKILSFKERNLVNHLSETKAFTNKENKQLSLDKIITTQNSNIKIKDVSVIKCVKEHSDYGHWPIQFEIQFA